METIDPNVLIHGTQSYCMDMESPFNTNNHIFKTKEPFKDHFVPNEIYEREDEFEQYTNYLQNIIDGFGPPNIFIYGQSGLGKTAMTEKMMEFLRADAEKQGINLNVITINCNKRDNTYGVICKLANELHESKTFKQGHTHEYIWDQIYTQLDEIGGDFLIILDEIDQLGEDDTILYEFPRARSMGEVSNARIGIIGISNNYLYRDNLRERVKSTLCEDEIEFTPYKAEELQTILTYYADLAFKNGVIEDNVITHCAAVTAQETGDARRALDLLETAGDVARRNQSQTVTVDHVQQAREEVERAEIKTLFTNSLPVQQQLVLLATTSLVMKTGESVRANDIYELYERFATDLHLNPVTKRHVRDFLGSLVEKGLLTAHDNNLGRSGGRWYTYEPSPEPVTIIEAVKESTSDFDAVLSDEVIRVARDTPAEDKSLRQQTDIDTW